MVAAHLWNDRVPQFTFPELFSFSKKKKKTLADAKSSNDISTLFHLPLSEEAYSQYLQLQDSLDEIQINKNIDKWTYIWGSDLFSSAEAYKQLSGTSLVHPIYRWL